MNLKNLNVVFDTNIYISSVLFGGKPGEVYRMGLKGNFRLSISTAILKEIEECLLYKFYWDVEKVQDFIGQISRIAKVLNVQKQLQGVCRDPKDDHVLSAAIDADADYIVSGDKDLLALKAYRNIQIVNAATFIRIVKT